MWPFRRHSSPTPLSTGNTPTDLFKDGNSPVAEEQSKHGYYHGVVKWPFDVGDERVMNALSKVPRDIFIPDDEREHAWENRALPIGLGQTISQPYIVALMTKLLEIKPDSRILEIGTGSGYQSAVLAELSNHVYTVEVIPKLSHSAQKVLDSLGYQHIHYRITDGSLGWPEETPFDGIIVTCVTKNIPPELWEQLKYPGGRLIIPIEISPKNQQLVLYKKEYGAPPPDPPTASTIPPTAEVICPVRFVPMVRGDH